MSKKLLVTFPGRNYSTSKPLLYYGERVFGMRDYDVISLDYDKYLNSNKDDLEGLIAEAIPLAFKKLRNIDFSKYEDVVFLSKSIGTAVAGAVEEKLRILARHIYLTPVAPALKYMRSGKGIVVAGKEDSFLDSKKLKIFCVGEDIALKQFDDVGHSLEYKDDISKTFAVLMVVVRLYKEF